ncbi:Glycosyl transferase CpsG [Streptococcus thermophilus]|uniref:Exopolysaccharide biosynthesis protein, glycosyltransferase n=2 Tax=Streptococcus thermophilus TaxID=1308 RepID=Q5M493_STRT2|nr:glycosyltransferase [Streptococcus thermophilus]AAV60743.1 exopolysaccharide biosynthesis protein, glycosyltransferase [Streptococcus thermophilus LMG 18311]MCE2345622.1 multidrug MFS transporter [Streptococcus thermophilus]MCT2948284.1 multidrug MFS transporter [Streptococcus thermophilus]MCT2963912.1 multidrug MFS transporter [Streptococcus thermophilus]UYI03505.1 multidrug MFS transporter [Streptococcus thermophilus]
MIFVTVGTHEQPFNRLIKEVDRLKKEGIITDEVFIQTGFSTYEPQYCDWKNIISYPEMEDYMNRADIIITHGGPATFMGAIAKGKKPIVVPRQEKFGEHVNDHQLDFAYQVKDRYDNIEVVEDIKTLQQFLKQDLSISESTTSNNKKFNEQLRQEVENIMG